MPESIGGKKLDFYHAMNMRGIVIIVMVVLIFPLMYALEEQNQGKKSEEKKKQMILDYPEIVSKLTLLLGAGMTVKRAWRKIVTDYEKEEQDLVKDMRMRKWHIPAGKWKAE